MNDPFEFSRRTFLRTTALASGAALSLSPSAALQERNHIRPNILMICADQFRWDFLAANRQNPSARTPHLDNLVHRGTNFRQTVCNQPLCSPSRASFLAGTYATNTKVWKLGLELDHSLPTIATTLKQSGYETAFMGKWHVSAVSQTDETTRGWVRPGPSRGGFDDLWEGANVLELVSHPYQGNYWDNEGKNIGFKDEYRVDFITDRAVHFLQQSHDRPWLLFVSQLEPHQQNDVDEFVPPKRYEDAYPDPFIPHDLRPLPGNWQSHLPGYYGCVNAIDDCVGRLVDTLKETGALDNTLIVFFSDHGCTFRTRLGEYKRSPHESSLRVPLVFAGPGMEAGATRDELVSLLDLAPTLIDCAGADLPESMLGRSLKSGSSAKANAADTATYIQLSQAICGRAIRTEEWIYCAFDPKVVHGEAEFSQSYEDFALYSLTGDPYQVVNLIGRPEYKNICDELRRRLKEMIVANHEPEPAISPVSWYS
jgi:arylsulfatase A-like enzyme